MEAIQQADFVFDSHNDHSDRPRGRDRSRHHVLQTAFAGHCDLRPTALERREGVEDTACRILEPLGTPLPSSDSLNTACGVSQDPTDRAR